VNRCVLDQSRTPADIASHLRDELGEGAYAFVSRRAEEMRQAADARGVRLWSDVASELLRLDRRPRKGDRGGPNSLRRVMQRVEYYRHRAAEVERKAAAAPILYRRDMLDLALQWRDLALHTDLQARSSDARADK
jgi:hypothetical protein